MSTLTPGLLGERVSELRRRRGLSQRELAAEVGRSESWVSQVERGVLPVERLSVLQALADALGVSVRELQPDSAALVAATPTAGGDLERLRLSLSGHPAPGALLGTSNAKPAPVDELRGQVAEAWRLTHASDFPQLTSTLVDLLPALELAVRQPRSRSHAELARLLAQTYQAAAAAFAQQDEPDAAWLAADRAVSVAEHSGDQLGAVAGLFRLVHAFLALRRLDQAEHTATRTLEALEPLVQSPDCPAPTLSLYGALHLVRSVIRARDGDRSGTRQDLDAARRTADRLGEDRNDYGTEFGPTNVQLHVVATALDLGDAGEALDTADGIDASHLSWERQTRLLMDLARAHTQRRHIGEAVAALLDAERLAPEQVRGHVLTRQVTRELLALTGRRAPTELTELARRVGASG